MTTTQGDSSATNGGTRALGSSYVVVQRIGRGATGEVWRGTDRRTGDDVAIKILRTEFAEDPSIVERFLRERALLSRLNDPHVVRLRDLVVEGDTVAIVTDLVAGGDLRARLDREGPMPPAEAIDLAAQVLDGLEAAHRHGIVHRDLKPENVLLVDGDEGLVARITDFGISTLAYSAVHHATSLIGSPEYMAPEVVQQHDVSGSADVYSAGILLYELLSGHTPFAGGSPIAVLRRQVDDAPPRLAGLPSDVWNELKTLLAKDPAARPRSAQIAAKRLRALADDVDGLSILPDDPDAAPATDVDDVIDLRDADDQPTFVPEARAGSGPERATSVPPRSDLFRPAAPVEVAHRRWPWAVAAVIALAGAGMGVWLGTRGANGGSRVEYTSPPVLRGGDVVVTRDWTLSDARGDNVTVRLHIRNLGTKTVTRFDEPQLTIVHPERGRPIHTYRLDLRPGASTTITYRTHVDGPLDTSRITSEFENAVEVAGLPHLGAVTVDPQSLELKENVRAYLNVSGVADGVGNDAQQSHASGALLAGIVWHSSDRGVVDVDQAGATSRPVLDAGHPGVATVSAQVGNQTLVSHVTVTASSANVRSEPCEPGTSDPPGVSSIADLTYIAGRGDPTGAQYVVVGGARLSVTGAVPADDYVQPVDDAVIDAMSSMPRDGTVLQTGPVYWIVDAGYRFPISKNDLTPAQVAAAVEVPGPALADIPRYDVDTFKPRAGTLVRGPGSDPTTVYLNGAWRTTTNVCSAAHVFTVLPPSTPPPST